MAQAESAVILFEFQDEFRFRKLKKFCDEWSRDQGKAIPKKVTSWPAFFDLRALCNFSWPHEEELEYVDHEWFDWLLAWMPDLSLLDQLCESAGPCKTEWDLRSLIETLKQASFQSLKCTKTKDAVGELEYKSEHQVRKPLTCLITVFEGRVIQNKD